MLRTDKIQAQLIGGVGFKNPTLPDYAIVDEANQLSTSGLHYEDASDLVSIRNIKDCQENEDITNEQFNELLANMQKSVVLDVCNKVIAGQSDFIGSYNLYPFEKAFHRTITPTDRFVGFEIEKAQGNIALSIPFVELCFDSVKTFNIYLYNSNKPKTAIQTKSVTTVAGEAAIVQLDWVIADDLQYKGGRFYLGYFESDLDGAKAYSREYENSSLGVSTPYCYVEPIALGHDVSTIDITDKDYQADTMGLNIAINVYNDYTELLLRNRSMLYNAIQLQMHERVLNLIKYSVRSNARERATTQMIDLELLGNPPLKIDGVSTKLHRSIEQVKKAIFYIPRVQRSTARL